MDVNRIDELGRLLIIIIAASVGIMVNFLGQVWGDTSNEFRLLMAESIRWSGYAFIAGIGSVFVYAASRWPGFTRKTSTIMIVVSQLILGTSFITWSLSVSVFLGFIKLSLESA